jgi:hypothetical protein
MEILWLNTLKNQGKALEVMMKDNLGKKNNVVCVNNDIFKVKEYLSSDPGIYLMKAYILVVNRCLHICPEVGLYRIKVCIDEKAQNCSSPGSDPGKLQR